MDNKHRDKTYKIWKNTLKNPKIHNLIKKDKKDESSKQRQHGSKE